ncbi:ABC transporter ATP-binding protein [Phytomonospora endophytica]|uniref:Peptide/nickel transport system ATP-binding protein n=1 Tax=Phytomonospora endophytica TaxID=714109 RepID=A0A841FSE3_9ACTN|nr:dipeptide/oligopeptide/nickel ABC transporter ATP-binding protein [Phytomonospora endophytica]MBB6034890.1 peptide/nickel transport system ATP-binding protein [Phytomonospora endophytica]GIG70594.1 ABC transporter ATP-binding protein [Phytomonospora endophytica]
MTPVVEARGLSRTYRRGRLRVPAVSDVDLTVAAGTVVGVEGPSGSGKSTLLRLLMRLEAPDSGELLLDGHASRRTAPGWAMPVFQDARASLDARWPVWRTVAEPLLRTDRAARRAAALDWLSRVGLGHVDPDARPRELSGGQCQRVAVARALIARPRVVFADEPTASLDATTAAGITRLLRAAADEHGTALVVVSHDADRLAVLADRIVRMDAGRLTA